MQVSSFPRVVLVTGATGNLGRKLIEGLACESACERIIGVDLNTTTASFSCLAQERLTLVQADLTTDGNWKAFLEGVEAVVHFAAASPLPDSSWEEALSSCDMTLSLLRAAQKSGVRRFVFASSNHTMGAYKDDLLGKGQLTSTLPPKPGTRWFNGSKEVHSLAYGTSKVMGERLCSAIAEASAGEISCVSVRIGWVLPDENDPRQITHSGAPSSTASSLELSDDEKRALHWFRDMWLSNDDFVSLFIAALRADQQQWPTPAVVVNGVSKNKNTVWDLTSAKELIGYEPQDDIHKYL
ncbi:NAD-dependent epimerase/dehydratase family protein [Pseudomonas sp. JZ134]|uniref:NAD-dependent epimerase/dehydratase family protein n=1 Tax=Pseudomonas sp. JZ134 TaxID=2806615 RepID=UPI003DA11AC5